jgi:predicted nucleic acid-binding protein
MKAASRERWFWDSSALVPLCFEQPDSSALRRLVRSSPRIAAWWGAPVEVRSALRRLLREGALDERGVAQALRRLDVLRRSWSEVQPGEELRGLAERALDRHDLRAADALQLAAGLVLCGERPARRTFVCLDARLAAAARALGFTVAP